MAAKVGGVHGAAQDGLVHLAQLGDRESGGKEGAGDGGVRDPVAQPVQGVGHDQRVVEGQGWQVGGAQPRDVEVVLAPGRLPRGQRGPVDHGDHALVGALRAGEAPEGGELLQVGGIETRGETQVRGGGVLQRLVLVQGPTGQRPEVLVRLADPAHQGQPELVAPARPGGAHREDHGGHGDARARGAHDHRPSRKRTGTGPVDVTVTLTPESHDDTECATVTCGGATG